MDSRAPVSMSSKPWPGATTAPAGNGMSSPEVGGDADALTAAARWVADAGSAWPAEAMVVGAADGAAEADASSAGTDEGDAVTIAGDADVRRIAESRSPWRK